MLVNYHKNCRVCEHELTPVFNLSNQCLDGLFVLPDFKPPTTQLRSELCFCTNCKLAQQRYSIDSDILYASYGYNSSTNGEMTKHLSEIVKTAIDIHGVNYRDSILECLDIGSNDFYLLKQYPKTFKLTGIDPGNFTPPENIKFINESYPSERLARYQFDILTYIACMYDNNEVLKTAKAIKDNLKDDGIAVVEVSYWPGKMKKGAFDEICFPPKTYIIGSNKHIEDINVGDNVLNINGEYSKVKNCFSREYTGDLINIKGLYLNTIRCTPQHPIYVYRDDEYQWIEAQNLSKADYLCIPKIKNISNYTTLDLSEFNQKDKRGYSHRGIDYINLDEDLAWILGLFAAEGHTRIGKKGHSSTLSFTLHEKELDLYEKIKNYFNKIGYRVTIVQTSKYKKCKAVTYTVTCSCLSKAFRKWIGSNSKFKDIPDFILFAANNIRIAFIRGLFSGDGYCKGGQVHLHSTSKNLIYKSQLILASLNAIVGVSYCKPPKENYINGVRIYSGDSWMLRGRSPELSNIFEHYVDYTRKKKRYIIQNDFILTPIQKISTENYSGKVFNIETESNTYLASNAVVHNCKEHVCFYSYENLEDIFNRVGLKIFRAVKNDINGGSVQIWLCKGWCYHDYSTPERKKEITKIKLEEFGLETNTLFAYGEFFAKCERLRTDCFELLTDLKKEGKVIHLYGCSTKGNVFLNYVGINSEHIEYGAERNPAKWGGYTLGSNIKMISEEESRAMKPDIYLCLIWGFKQSVIEREKEFIEHGGKFIFPFGENGMEIYPE